MAVEIVEIQGPARGPQTDALRVLAPGARYSVRDRAGVVLADGRQIAPFDAVMEVVGADLDLISAASDHNLKHIDQYLISRTFLIGHSLSVTDRAVLGLLHAHVASLPDPELYKYCCVARWFDHVQFAAPALPHVTIKTTINSRPQKEDKKAKKAADKSGAAQSSAVADSACFDIRIGHIIDVEGHPSDPGLYVEQIDLGESGGPRQIVSGLARFVPAAEMRGRYVCVLVNLGACEIKGVKSSGLVLCASNADHTVVEPVRPADGVTAGERVMFPGVPAQDTIEVLKPKRLHKLVKLLRTTDDPEPFAVCGDLPFMSSRGRIYSSAALRNCHIK